ncbi:MULTISPECIES: FkbM family methyltransferase [unclassified Amycolatopsis]|uniref:FkbM family methyltransferase n=1 Tax=unclassified Amycolatopsis TaxID=2618356 RepID=UPI002E13513B|nr:MULTISPECIES: FkbM family methyltransferase [unclassified Amycolatopsis]WSJ78748.1 FkbM family methyltransferase [Amycolatopsis sp. NBC_01307]WSK77695.1 FkbM family methyltransferase [Amycolatopsis sp. NBC_01286]
MTMDAIALHSINPWEVSFLREEVAGYFAHGIEFAPGATVLDVGANVGVFSAAVYERLDGDVRIFAFEPLPPLYETLERNAREFFGGRLTALPFGLSSAEDELDFSYFPAATIFSSSLRDAGNVEAERKRVTASIVEMIRRGGLGATARRVPAPVLRGIVGRKLRVMRELETHRVRVRPLSPVLDEQAIDRIDLLKVDVEGAELDVLHGIEDRHWPLVRQAVVEVEGWRRNRDTIREVFAGKGFTVSAEQDPVQEAADIGMVFAVR